MAGSRQSIARAEMDPDTDGQSEWRFRLLAEAIPQIVWTARPDGDRDYLNGRWSDYTGMTREESLGTGWVEAVHPEDRGHCYPERSAVSETAGPFELEYRLRRSDGAYRWVLARAEPICDDDGRVVRWFGTCTDIDDRKRAEDLRLRESEERFRMAAEAVGGLIYEWDLATDRVERTAGLLALTGFRPDEAEPTGDWWRRRVHPDDLEAMFAGRDASIARGEPLHEAEYRLRHRDGRYRHVWDRARFVYDADGRLVRVVGFAIDLTALRGAEIALRESQTRLQRFADSDIIGVLFGDIDGGISYANDEFLRIVGYSREEFEANGIGWAAVTPPEWLPVDERAIAAARACGGPCRPYEKEYVRKDGSRISVLVGFTLFGATETVAFILDLTARKQAESVLREADRRKDEFLAMIAHELRSPLAAIRNAFGLLGAPQATDADRALAHEIADRQVGNLMRLVDDLLDVARVASGKIQLRTERLDAATVVARAVESVRPLFEGRRQRLSVSVAPGPMPIAGDLTRLEQVLSNLLNNAAKYTDEGGRIRVDASPEGREIAFRVTDTGIGIAAEMLPKVFDMFTQVDSARDRSHGGLGIGLRLVRELTELHGGRVTAASAGPGKGSEFTVRLPLLAGDGP